MSTNSEKTEGKKNRKIFYIILIIVLLVINALLFYNNLQTRSDRDEYVEKTQTLEEEKAELSLENKELIADIDALNADLEKQRGQNAELDAKINEMQAELEQRKQEYLRNINSSRNETAQVRKELQNARAEWEQVKNQYLEEIENLQVAQRELQDTLIGRDQNIRALETTIKKGQVLSSNNIQTYGVRYRNNNKEVETDNANKVEKLKICFQVAENRIAEPGFKPILIKVVSPEGSTLALESMGSGTFEMDNGESSLYTKKININYDPATPDKQYCTEWSQNTPFQPGVYNVELYHQGMLIGNSELELDKGGLF